MPMLNNERGRIAPSATPLIQGTGKSFVGAYPWNAPREAISRDPYDRPLTRDEHRQVQAVLAEINTLPHNLCNKFSNRYYWLKRHSSQLDALRFLTSTFKRRLWPRIERVNRNHRMNTDASIRFLSEQDAYSHLPGMNDKALEKFAGRIAAQLFSAYEELSDSYASEHEGDKKEVLFTDEAQSWLYGEIAGAARAFNVTPLHWKKYRKGKLTAREAFSAVFRLITDDWWVAQFKAQRTRWNEALLIAVGEVSKKRSPYASKQAIRDVHARRLANLEYLKSRELENVETGERIDLIDKVLKSISNPEIRRMELMNTIAGIERYASSKGDVGLFITITTPSKYHPTRVTGADKTVQLNHKWNDEAYSPKEGQRYLCGIWSKMRTAFKDNGLNVYGMRVVEPHHDGTPHWHMMLFCQPDQRQQVIGIMSRYSLKEDGDERGAAKNRFECKHLNKGGAAGYIAKYIAKNIDGYALDGELDKDTGKPLKDTAAAVNAWASTWRIPQFKPIGVPTMGAYRELRKLPRGVSIASELDERVEDVRAAADGGDFDLYIAAQGGANVPRDAQTVRVARKVADELNAYDEEVQKVVGIFAPHLGSDNVHVTRTTQWRIVAKAVDVDLGLLTLKSGSAATRSPVNNCGLDDLNSEVDVLPTASEQAAAVLNLLDSGDVSWRDADVLKVLRDELKEQSLQDKTPLQSHSLLKSLGRAPSARLTRQECERFTQIRFDLSKQGIIPNRWELEVLTRGGTVTYKDKIFSYPIIDYCFFRG
ncbi:replication endonuclease [Buttiauxella sp. S04-F03]|uniref:replication endonuclease n=1 Tax=Buttiauxella sp. S04-F03 TaxID=2904525 RepID=UPI00351D72BA